MVATYYAWDPEFDCITKETDAAGAVTARYTQEPKLYGGLISQDRSGVSSFYHYDAVGTTRALTNSSQATTDTAVYSAFGEKVTSIGTTVNVYQFVGQSGYVAGSVGTPLSVRARSFIPSNAVWLTIDPYFFISIQSLIRPYRYCENRPTLNIDPSGLISIKLHSKTIPKNCPQLGAWYSMVEASWVFSLDKQNECRNPKDNTPESGYIIQRVGIECNLGNCAPDSCFDPAQRRRREYGEEDIVYFEAWEVEFGKKRPRIELAGRAKFTDGQNVPIVNETCGNIIANGLVGFFCKSVTGFLGDPLAPKPPDPSTGWTMGASYIADACGENIEFNSGSLPSYFAIDVNHEPKWWGGKFVISEGVAHRALKVGWRCCGCRPEMIDVSLIPE